MTREGACASGAYGRNTERKTRRRARLVGSAVNLPPRGGDTDKFILSFPDSSNVFSAVRKKNRRAENVVDFLRKIRKFFLTIWESSFNIAAYFFCGRRNMYRTVLVSDVNNERLNRLLEKVGMVLTPLSQDARLKRLSADGADFVGRGRRGGGTGAATGL